MVMKRYNPGGIAPPFSTYSHALEAPGDWRWLHVSGQVGVTLDGTMLDGFEAQATQAWKNLLEVLTDAGMGPADIVKVNVFLTDVDQVPASRAAREAALDGVEPASTLLIVAGLASPDWLIEIELIAAAPA
jgi:enamine deaminase RidA (YjgF/YER057c/UK114 family)